MPLSGNERNFAQFQTTVYAFLIAFTTQNYELASLTAAELHRSVAPIASLPFNRSGDTDRNAALERIYEFARNEEIYVPKNEDHPSGPRMSKPSPLVYDDIEEEEQTLFSSSQSYSRSSRSTRRKKSRKSLTSRSLSPQRKTQKSEDDFDFEEYSRMYPTRGNSQSFFSAQNEEEEALPISRSELTSRKFAKSSTASRSRAFSSMSHETQKEEEEENEPYLTVYLNGRKSTYSEEAAVSKLHAVFGEERRVTTFHLCAVFDSDSIMTLLSDSHLAAYRSWNDTLIDCSRNNLRNSPVTLTDCYFKLPE